MQAVPCILLVALSLLTTTVIYNGQTPSGSECERSVDVAIIGAGPAGSYFAYRLRDAGLSIELFEYSNRIGGRLFTTTLPNIPDVNLELGGMRYFRDEHVRVHRLVQELNLTSTEFSEDLGRKDRKKYFLRGKILTAEDVMHGEVPYNLSSEEKRNQGDLALYYLKKLTGFNGTLTEKMALELKARNGTEMYKLTIDEAMGMVATPEGRQFLKNTVLYDCAYNSDMSTVDYCQDHFNTHLYYLEQLTGFNGTLTEELTLKLKTKDGRALYELTVDEAISMVATPGGRLFLKESEPLFGSAFESDISIADYFIDSSATGPDTRILTLTEGMSSIPKSLVNVFLKSSDRNKLTFNRKLEAVTKTSNSDYTLNLVKTTTTDGVTHEEGTFESVCAKKVVLAIPQFALTRLKWTPLSSPKVKAALYAVTPFKASKVFMAFPTAWWLNVKGMSTYMVSSDLPFRQMYDWKSSHVSGDYVLLASYAEGKITEFQQSLNSEGELAPGSDLGANKVTDRLKDELLHNLGQVFAIDAKLIPEQTAAVSQFWTSYPFGGGWTHWLAGRNFTDVLLTMQRPSCTDEVYIVGSDHSFVGRTAWTESALTTVDLVYDKYFV